MRRQIAGLAAVEAGYDGFIVDLWGVIHDGVRPYPGALDCLERLRGRRVLLLSNAPRRAWAAQASLRALGIPDDAYSAILTSGEATWLALRNRSDPWFAGLGQRVFHIGPERDRNVVEQLDLIVAHTPGEADFVLNTGPDDLSDPTRIEPFLPVLDACRQAGLRMICANPDLVVVRDGLTILCAGALAARYEAMGGEVRSIGKPAPAIYDMALAMLGVPKSRVLAVGDSLHTDIAGAAMAGIDCVWVLGGIHEAATTGSPEQAETLLREAGLAPLAAMRNFVW